jgi:hypothetical protein
MLVGTGAMVPDGASRPTTVLVAQRRKGYRVP